MKLTGQKKPRYYTLNSSFFGGRGLTKYNDFDCREVKYSQIPNVYVLNILRVAWTQHNNQIPVYSF